MNQREKTRERERERESWEKGKVGGVCCKVNVKRKNKRT